MKKNINTYNLFKVYNIVKLKTKIDKLIFNNELEEIVLNINDLASSTFNEYSLKCYLSKNQNVGESPKWTHQYNFADEYIKNTLPYQPYCIILLISKDPKDCIYVITYGKAHFYISSIADPDYGINIASKGGLFDLENLKMMKSQNVFKTVNSSKLISSKTNCIIEPENGDVYSWLKSNVIKHDDIKSIIFGTSLKLTIKGGLEKLPIIIKGLEQLEKSKNTLNIPILKIVNNEIIDRLNLELINNLKIVDDNIGHIGTQIIFSDDFECDLWIKGNKKSTLVHYDSLSKENIYDYIQGNEIGSNGVHDVMVKFYGYSDYVKPLNECIVHETEIDGKSYLYMGGQWRYYNEVFIDQINSTLKKFPISNVPISYLKYKSSIDNKYEGKDKKLREKEFNELLVNDGYRLFDKKNINIDEGIVLEICDIYKDREANIVKIGKNPKSILYVFDQAVHMIKVFKDEKVKLAAKKIDLNIDEIKTINIWIILQRQSSVRSLDEINSIHFKLRCTQFITLCKEYNIDPKISIECLDSI